MYLIEYRSKLNSRSTLEADVALLASTKQKAIKWIKKNKDYSNAKIWWWAIYEIELDIDPQFDDIQFYSPNGKRLKNQPWI
jgi:hypothetical protein